MCEAIIATSCCLLVEPRMVTMNGLKKENQPIAFAGIKIHVLGTGWEFDIRSRGITVPHHHDTANSSATHLVASSTTPEGDTE